MKNGRKRIKTGTTVRKRIKTSKNGRTRNNLIKTYKIGQTYKKGRKRIRTDKKTYDNVNETYILAGFGKTSLHVPNRHKT